MSGGPNSFITASEVQCYTKISLIVRMISLQRRRKLYILKKKKKGTPAIKLDLISKNQR